MKNYFNQYESNNHLAILASTFIMQDLINTNSLTTEETNCLEKAKEYINKFTYSVFNRLGEGYKRSIANKADMNTLKIVSKNCHHTNNVDRADFIDADILYDIIKVGCELDCAGCKRTDCKNCTIYKIKSYLNYEGKSDDTNLCPFREEEYKFDSIEVDDLKY